MKSKFAVLKNSKARKIMEQKMEQKSVSHKKKKCMPCRVEILRLGAAVTEYTFTDDAVTTRTYSDYTAEAQIHTN